MGFVTRLSRTCSCRFLKRTGKVVPENNKRKRRRKNKEAKNARTQKNSLSLSAFDRERLSFLRFGYLKLLLSHCQLLHTLVTIYFVPWTLTFQRFLSVFDFVDFHLNLVSGVLRCYVEDNFMIRVAVGLGFPLFIYLLAAMWETCFSLRERCRTEIVGVGAAKIKRLLQQKLKRKRRRWAVMDRFLLPFMMFLYVPTATFVTRLFVCEPPPSTEDALSTAGWRLEIDNSIRCYDDSYIFTIGIPGTLGVLAYVLGTPLLFIITLRRKLSEVRFFFFFFHIHSLCFFYPHPPTKSQRIIHTYLHRYKMLQITHNESL